MTPSQLQSLQHSLGVDQYGQGRMYRNHFVGGEEDCRPLVAMGFMVERPASDLTGGAPCFHVTEAGKRAMIEESPKPPKLKRSQLRYRRFLDCDSGISFREWLRDWEPLMEFPVHLSLHVVSLCHRMGHPAVRRVEAAQDRRARSGKRMKCPACVDSGRHSVIDVSGGGIRTLMGEKSFYDENGDLHFHSLNRTCIIFKCSNGHDGKIITANRCSVKGCGFGHADEISNSR